MKLKIFVEAMREEEYEYDLETTKKIVLGKKGMFSYDLCIKPINEMEDSLEFEASGIYTKYGCIKFATEKDKQALLNLDGVYTIKKGEKIKFLPEQNNVKDAGCTYYISIE